MNEDHPEISEDRLFYLETQEIVVNDFDAPGYILDIGGGGEGIMGRLKGKQVVAIDPNRRELEQAPAGPLKIVMDARDLQFLDGTFTVATSFFTLMYIKGPDHEKVFREVFRVLKPGGRFFIWDVILPARLDPEKDIAVVSLRVKLPEEDITAGYGHVWPEKGRDLSYFVQLAEAAGFNVYNQREEGPVFFLELRKPQILPSKSL